MGTFGMITGAITSYFLNHQTDLIPNDDLDEYILNSPNYTDSKKKEIINTGKQLYDYSSCIFYY